MKRSTIRYSQPIIGRFYSNWEEAPEDENFENCEWTVSISNYEDRYLKIKIVNLITEEGYFKTLEPIDTGDIIDRNKYESFVLKKIETIWSSISFNGIRLFTESEKYGEFNYANPKLPERKFEKFPFAI